MTADKVTADNVTANHVMTDVATVERWKAQPGKFVRDLSGVTPDPWQDEVWKKWQRISHPVTGELPAPPEIPEILERLRRESASLWTTTIMRRFPEQFRRIFFLGQSGVPDEPTPQDIRKSLKFVLSRSVAKGGFAAALKSIEPMGRPLAMWDGDRSSPAPGLVQTGGNDLADALAARKLHGGVSTERGQRSTRTDGGAGAIDPGPSTL